MINELEMLAMYLPQFHRCPQNDLWWGEGFTEWDLVKKTLPIIKGQNQPRIPSMGYYDLSDGSHMTEQFSLAQQYGITGFNMYLYWSSGSKLLESVAESILKNKNINTRYCFTWANHPWTRTWNNRAGSKEVLFPQDYETTNQEIEKFVDYLHLFFADTRYIKYNSKPLFYIYKPEDIPNLNFFIEIFREIFITKYQLDIHIVAFINNQKDQYHYLNNFDSIAIFNPTASLFSSSTLFNNTGVNLSLRSVYNSIQSPLIKSITSRMVELYPKKYRVHDYEAFWEKLILQYKLSQKFQDLNVHPMAMVDFDNTPRYGKRARVFINVTPDLFQSGVEQLLDIIKHQNKDSNILLINAWNEWGEGMHLEPDTNNGLKFLEALKKAKSNIL